MKLLFAFVIALMSAAPADAKVRLLQYSFTPSGHVVVEGQRFMALDHRKGGNSVLIQPDLKTKASVAISLEAPIFEKAAKVYKKGCKITGSERATKIAFKVDFSC